MPETQEVLKEKIQKERGVWKEIIINNIDGGELRVLNDDEILGTIEDPEDILHALTV